MTLMTSALTVLGEVRLAFNLIEIDKQKSLAASCIDFSAQVTVVGHRDALLLLLAV